MTNEKQIQQAIDCLNSAYKADPDAIHTLIALNKTPCNQSLVDHPHIVVGKNRITDGWNVGTLGVINGVLTSMGLNRIAIKWSDEKDADGMYKFLGFCEYNPSNPSSQN